MRPLVKYWRQQGLRIVLYLDYGIAAVQGEQAALAASKIVQADLEKAGLIVNITSAAGDQNSNVHGSDLTLHFGRLRFISTW